MATKSSNRSAAKEPAKGPAKTKVPATSAGARRTWLVKSEPSVYAIDALEQDGRTAWTGVRNYQARNFMRDDMKVGDLVLFYHSSTEPPGVAGLAKVVSDPYPDPLQFDAKSEYFDPASTVAEPRWQLVDLGFVERFPRPVTLTALKGEPSLAGMLVLQKGQRLSVQPVDAGHFGKVLAMAGARTRIT
ncbi:MAG: EVE domain-containing protein [Deltaproteobacteria bacterium]|nr:EVE domain-containing protein [Deltaproteobacteria bacterium]